MKQSLSPLELAIAEYVDIPDAKDTFTPGFDVPGRMRGVLGRKQRGGDRVEVLELRTMMSADPTSSMARLAALEDQLRSFPSDADLAAQISASEARIALFKAELATAMAHQASPIDAVEWPNGVTAFPGEGNRGSLAINPAGTVMVTTSQGAQPILTDIASGQEILRLNGHNAMVTSVAFSPDGTIIATASHDGNARIFDAKTGALKDTFALNGLGSSATFTPDGEKVVINVNGVGARIYDLKTKQFTAEFPGGSPVAPVFSRDGSTAFFTDENVVGRKDMINGTVQSFNPGIDRIKALDLSADGKTIAIGGVSGTVKLLDAATMQTITTIPSRGPWPVNALAFDGSVGLFVCYDDMWNFTYAKGTSWGNVTIAEKNLVNGYSVNPRMSARFATVVFTVLPDKGTVTTIMKKTLHPAAAVVGRPVPSIENDLTTEEAKGKSLVGTQTNKRNTEQSIVEVRVTVAGEEKDAAAAPSKADLDAVFAEITKVVDGEKIVTIDILQWNTVGAPTESKGTMNFPGEGTRYTFAMDPTGTVMVTTSQKAQPILVDVASGRELMRLNGHSQPVSAIAFSRDGARIVTGSYDGIARIFDREGNQLQTIDCGAIIAAITCTPDGMVALALNGHETRVWNPATGTFAQSFPGGSAVAPVFTQDGKAVYGDEELVGWVNEESGESARINPGIGRIKGMAIDPGETRMVVGSADGAVALLDLKTLEIVAKIPCEGRGCVNGVAFNGSNRIIVCYDDGSIVLYDCSNAAQGQAMPIVRQWKVNGYPVSPSVSERNEILFVHVLPKSGQDSVIAAFDLPPGAVSDGPLDIVKAKKPMLEAVGIHGAWITLAVSSNVLGMNSVEFSGLHDGGAFTGVDFHGSAEDTITPISLSITEFEWTGDYAIVLLASGKTREVARIPVHWDQVKRELSLIGGKSLWTPPAESQNAIGEELRKVQALKSAAASDPTLAGFQQTVLMEGIKALPVPYGTMIPECDAAFWKIHPEWRDDVIHETARLEFEKHPLGNTITSIYDGMMRGRTASMSTMREAYGHFSDEMGSILLDALRVLSEIARGGDERRLRSDFEGRVGMASGASFMITLSDFGIGLPKAWVVLDGVQKVWETEWRMLAGIREDEGRVTAMRRETQEKTANDLVQLAGGTWVAKTDPRVQPLYVDALGRETTIAQGQTPDAVLVAARNSVTDVMIGGISGETIHAGAEKNDVPNSKNTMIVVIYGSDQEPNDQIAGFENLVTNLQHDYEHILSFTPGKNPSAVGKDRLLPSPYEAMQSMKEQLQKAFQENKMLKNVVIVGYSWGGGAVYEISMWITDNKKIFDIRIAATVYVDAITNPAASGGSMATSASAENRLPPGTQAMLNIYQSKAHLVSDGTLNGGPISQPSINDFQQIDLDIGTTEQSDRYTHDSIDEASIWIILDFIQTRIHSKRLG